MVKCPSVYNVILGRPALNSLKAITSTYHLAIKFSTERGVGVVCDDQFEARKCYATTVKDKRKVEEVMHVVSTVEPTAPTKGKGKAEEAMHVASIVEPTTPIKGTSLQRG